MRKGLLAVAAAAALSLGVAGKASAATIDISTGANGGWQVNGLTAQVIATPHPNWNDDLVNSQVKWIGVTGSNYGTTAPGEYVYSLTFVPPLSAGEYRLDVEYTSDNTVTLIMFGGKQLFSALPDNSETEFANSIYSFRHTFTANGSATTPQTLQFTVYNAGTSANPSGLIVSGAVTAVPLPSAAWAGLGLLGVMGVARVRRSMR